MQVFQAMSHFPESESPEIVIHCLSGQYQPDLLSLCSVFCPSQGNIFPLRLYGVKSIYSQQKLHMPPNCNCLKSRPVNCYDYCDLRPC